MKRRRQYTACDVVDNFNNRQQLVFSTKQINTQRSQQQEVFAGNQKYYTSKDPSFKAAIRMYANLNNVLVSYRPLQERFPGNNMVRALENQVFDVMIDETVDRFTFKNNPKLRE